MEVARIFYDGLDQPWMVILNGVPNSPSHQQWEVLRSGFGYLGKDAFRSVIDSVRSPLVPARLAQPTPIDGGIEFFIKGPSGKTYAIERSNALAGSAWERIGSVVASNAGTPFRDASIQGGAGPFYYRAVAE